MKRVLIKGVCKITLALVVCGLLSNFLLGSDVMVEIGNQIALGQMENSDFNFNVLKLYNMMRHTVFVVEGSVLVGTVLSIFVDIYKEKKGHIEKDED